MVIETRSQAKAIEGEKSEAMAEQLFQTSYEEDDPISELENLHETIGLKDYHERFELIRSRVNLSDAMLVSKFLAGLEDDMQKNIRMFHPQSVDQCMLVGKLYEQAYPKKYKLIDLDQLQGSSSNMSVIPEIEIEPIGVEELILPSAIQEDTDSESMKDKGEIMEAGFLQQSILQSQVQVSFMEPCHRFPNDLVEVEFHQEKRSHVFDELDVVEYKEKLESVESMSNAHQVFDSMLKRNHNLQRVRKLRLTTKFWLFKFRLKLIQGFCVNLAQKFQQEQKRRKLIKSGMFKYKYIGRRSHLKILSWSVDFPSVQVQKMAEIAIGISEQQRQVVTAVKRQAATKSIKLLHGMTQVYSGFDENGLFGSSSWVSTSGKRTLRKNWWFKYKLNKWLNEVDKQQSSSLLRSNQI